MERHFRGKSDNSNLIHTRRYCFQSLPNKQQNFTTKKKEKKTTTTIDLTTNFRNNKTLDLSKFKAFAGNRILRCDSKFKIYLRN